MRAFDHEPLVVYDPLLYQRPARDDKIVLLARHVYLQVSNAAVSVRCVLVCEADHDVTSEVDVHTEDVEALRVSAVLASEHVNDLVQSLTLRPLVPLLAFEQL